MTKKDKKKTNVFEAIVRYALAKYDKEFLMSSADCPYETRMGGNPAFMQEISWFVYEWKNPKTGITILEEFVAKKLKGKTEQAARLLRRKEIIHGKFEVIDVSNSDDKSTMTVRLCDDNNSNTQKEYTVLVPNYPPKQYIIGYRFLGRIHPKMQDGTYAICGVSTVPGQWNINYEATAIVDLAKSGIGRRLLFVAAQTTIHQAKSRNGPGRDIDKSKRKEKILVHKKFFELVQQSDLSKVIMESDMMMDLVKRSKKEDKAFEDAIDTTISRESNLKTVLQGYPKDLLKIMCLELGIGSMPSIDAMAERISNWVPSMVCHILYKMGIYEQKWLARVMYSGAISLANCDAELTSLGFDESTDEDYDSDVNVSSFINIYTYYGLLIVGTGMLDGRMQKMITVAPDIKKCILECPGWRKFAESGGIQHSVDSMHKTH